jgi:uncharacterized protein with NAD-binding domain and iron-sulfur cluster
MEQAGNPPRWAPPWPLHFAHNDREPGTADAHPPRIHHLISLIEWLGETIAEYLLNRREPGGVHHPRKHAFLSTIQTHLQKMADAVGRSRVEAPLDTVILDAARLGQAALQLVTRFELDLLERDTDFRRVTYGIDLSLATISGFIRSDLLNQPWESIDHLDFHEWLGQNGLTPFSRWCSPIRAVYDLAFGYERGVPDEAHANMAAGSTLRGLMWMLFGYSGSIMYKMQAGMGDTVFAPVYQLLKRDYDVPFYYFHRVLELVPASDGSHIERIRIGIQAKPKDGAAAYDALTPVNGLECWPSEPLWSQLENGDALKASGVNFEAPDSPLIGEIELVAGKDFDFVVFGASIGSVPQLCARLIAQKPAWKSMVDHVKTVRTQAFQLWLNKNVQELGWSPATTAAVAEERAVLGTFVEPLDTWADMSQLIPRETWTPEQNVQQISYFCGPLPETPVAESAETNLHGVLGAARGFMGSDVQVLWPKTVDSKQEFPWDWLVDPENGEGFERFRRQYFRANTEGSELYVLSVKGSTQHRLLATDTGYANLSIAGDWNRNRLSLGCVESAVMGGIDAVQTLVDDVQVIDEEGTAKLGSD